MLRSKFHRPWQPQLSDSQPFNPFVQGGEADSSLSEQIAETQEESQLAAHSQPERSPAPEGLAPDTAAAPPAAAPVRTTPQWQRWYETLFGRFVRH